MGFRGKDCRKMNWLMFLQGLEFAGDSRFVIKWAIEVILS